jgi:hypothetical protein
MIPDDTRRLISSALAHHLPITWERERRLANTNLFVALLKPSSEISQTFGFEREIPLFVSPYPKLQPRSMQALEQICSEHPLAGRIDPTVAFFHSSDPNLVQWMAQYHSENPESRIVVPLTKQRLERAIDNRWDLINAIKEVLFIRNLFDYKLPLKSDRYFYGREDIVASIIDNIRKSQNTGLFGLRKTGKTSVLLKVQRTLQKAGDVETIFIDCKNRPIRKSSCDSLAKRILVEVDKRFGKKFSSKFDEGSDIFDTLDEAIQSIPTKKKLCIVFDEIEYISPISPTDPHWSNDFIDFWQALWTIQTKTDKISYIVCGVNPTVCDIDRFSSASVPGRTVQNPMFSIFNIQYLRGLSLDNLSNMIDFFGSRMGMFFDKNSIKLLFNEYGGHPLLTRLACSFQHEMLEAKNKQRPIKIAPDDIREFSLERDAELSSYCGHVVSEIKELYPDEYELLKLLAAGEVADFNALTGRSDDVRHIREYGLVAVEHGKVPEFKIPVVRRFLRHTEKENIRLDEIKRFEAPESRHAWLKRRVRSIIDDLLLLNDGRVSSGLPGLYAKHSSLKGHEFVEIPLVTNEAESASFLIQAHKYLVEPMDKTLKGGVANGSMFTEELPNLRKAFLRLKTYRNKLCHIEVNEATARQYSEFLLEDFDGTAIENLENGWFRLQRRIIDHIHVALQAELSCL